MTLTIKNIVFVLLDENNISSSFNDHISGSKKEQKKKKNKKVIELCYIIIVNINQYLLVFIITTEQ